MKAIAGPESRWEAMVILRKHAVKMRLLSPGRGVRMITTFLRPFRGFSLAHHYPGLTTGATIFRPCRGSTLEFRFSSHMLHPCPREFFCYPPRAVVERGLTWYT